MTEMNKADNVISMFSHRQDSGADQELVRSLMQEEGTSVSAEEMFQATMKRNADIQKRLRDSRLKSNKSVLKSYRIKK